MGSLGPGGTRKKKGPKTGIRNRNPKPSKPEEKPEPPGTKPEPPGTITGKKKKTPLTIYIIYIIHTNLYILGLYFLSSNSCFEHVCYKIN